MQVAIKVYYHEPNEIDQEPALIAAISHENVLRVHDARSLSQTCSFFMTPCANRGDLGTHLNEHYIPTDLAYRLLTQLLSGLSALHENRLVHRDLKPENLLVHDETLLIADFGSVRRVSEDTGAAPASRHSILFRPPEAFGDSSYFNFASDTYQAGLVGYLLFGGRLSNDLESHLSRANLSRLEGIKASDGSFEVSQFIDSCLEKSVCAGKLVDWAALPLFVPKAIVRCLKRATIGIRYASCSEFLADLQRAGAGMPRWAAQGDTWVLADWNGRDYRLSNLGGNVAVHKRARGKSKFIADHELSGGGLRDVYDRLASRLRLP
jgi:serine/threonine protein kinase